MPSPNNPSSFAQQTTVQQSEKFTSRATGKTLQEEHTSWGRLPVEWPSVNAHSGWRKKRAMRIFATLRCLCTAPQKSFYRTYESIQHTSIIRFLAALRLPLWLILLLFLSVQWLWIDASEFMIKPIHGYLDPYLAEVVSLWLLLLIPLGIPLLYFFLGLAAHVSLAVTGGASQSISATMRASGFSLAPSLLGLGCFDIPLYLHICPGWLLLVTLLVFASLYFWQLTNALIGTHQISFLQGMAAAALPSLMFGGIIFIRGILEVSSFPGWSPPPFLPYIVP